MKVRVSELVATGLLLATVALHAQPAVRGQVLDQRGNPLTAARVELLPVLAGYEQGLRRLTGRDPVVHSTTETDSLGRFFLPAGEPGVFAVRVAAAGKVALSFEPLPLVEETELPPALPPDDIGTTLVVQDAAGRPAPGIWVFGESEEGEGPPLLGGWRIAPRIGRTRADGSLVLSRVASEKLRIHAFFGAGAEEVRQGFLGGAVSLRPATLTRKLRVLDARGRPVAGALVRLGDVAWPIGLTDAEGRLAVRGGGESSLRLRLATADGRRLAARLPPTRAAAGQGPEDILVLHDAPVQTGSLRQDENGRPLAGALVWSRADPGVSSLTDAEGRYRIPAPKGDTVWLEARAPGRLPQRASLEAQSSGTGRAPTLALERAGEIVGSVVDATGKPISGAWVSVLPPGKESEPGLSRPGPMAGGGASGADGGFRLIQVKRGQAHFVQATKAGFLTSGIDLPVAASASRSVPVVLVLPPTRQARGRVVDEDGRPVAGAEVRLAAARPYVRSSAPSALEGLRPSEPPDAVSDPGGRFAVAAIPTLALDIEVSRQGYARAVVRNCKVPPGSGVVDLGTLLLRPGVTLAGIVLDGRDRPVPGARVFRVEELTEPFELAERLRHVPPAAFTGEDGRFSLADQVRGLPAHLFVSASGFLPATARGVRPPTVSPVRIRLAAGGRFAGRVLDPERLPLSGADVELRVRPTAPGREDISFGKPVVATATTDRDGRFVFADLPAGQGTLAASAAGFVAVQDLEVALPQAAGEEATVMLTHGATLEGTVTTTAGDAVSGVRVIAGSAVCLSDADGVFRAEGVPIGPLGVEATHPHYARYRRRLAITDGFNRLEVVFEAGSVVRGRVVNADGRPLGGAAVVLEGGQRGRGLSYRARTDAGGDFTLEPVATGPYRLSASADGYVNTSPPQPITVRREPIEGLEVVLESGGEITGRILGLPIEELPRVVVRAEHGSGESKLGEIDAAGRYALRHLRNGGWLVLASLPDGQRHARARVLLAAGEAKTHDLRFGERFTLSGRVLYRDQALADALVSIRGQGLAVERSTFTDYEGAFRLEDLDADSYWLGLNHTGELLVHNEIIQLASDRDMTIRLERVAVAGTVRDAASEEAIAFAVVSLRHVPGSDGSEFVIADDSDASGAFRLERVPPGLYRLGVSHEGHVPTEREIEVAPGSDLLGVDVSLQLSSGAELTVRHASGAVPALVHLRLVSPSGLVVVAESRSVGSGGKVRLSSAPPGSWTLLAASPQSALTIAHLSVPGEPLELVLPDAVRLSVRVPSLVTSDTIATVSVFGAGGQPLETLGLGGILKQQWPLIAGAASVEGVSEGTWTVTATAPDGRTWSAVVATDGRADVQVDLE